MRKRSVQEIIEATVTSSTTRQKRINQEKRRKALEKVAQQRSADQNKKPDLATAKIRDLEARTEVSKARRDALVARTEKTKQDNARSQEKKNFADKKASVASKEKFAKGIAGGKPNLEKISKTDKSVSATGKAAMNLAKSATSIGRKVASIPSRISAQKDRRDFGKAQMEKGQAPTAGTTGQKIRYAARPVTRAVSNAATSIRRTTGRGVQKVGSGMSKFGKKLQSEDFIHEAEKGKKEIKKEKIDVMKGTNKIEVNPKSLPEAKKMTKKQIEKRDEIADAISTREMNKRYGDKNVKYAIATKLAMKKKKKKKKKIDEAKEEGGYISNLAKAQVRNKRRFGKEGSTEARGYFGQKPSEALELSKKRTDEHKARRGVKNESVSGLEVQNVSDGIKFREYEFIDVVKPEPMRSPKNNITWTEARDEYGDLVGGPKISKKQLKKNLISNTPDEQHTTTTSEAKMPVKGLMKLAATVAANNKKRKNALQIQKYIGEETPDAISGKDLKRISALSGKQSRFGDGSEGKAKRKAALEKKRGMKLDDHPQFQPEGKGSDPNKRYIGDPIVTSKKSFTQTGKIGIDYYTDDEKKKSEKEKIKDAKDPKKNTSRERATQNMQMLKRMTPEQKYARKMRIEKQKKDKK